MCGGCTAGAGAGAYRSSVRRSSLIEVDSSCVFASRPSDYSDPVNARSVVLREELLALPVEERAEFAVELLASLDDEHSLEDPVAVDLVWRDELLRRSEQIPSGAVVTVGWEQVLERVADSRRTR